MLTSLAERLASALQSSGALSADGVESALCYFVTYRFAPVLCSKWCTEYGKTESVSQSDRARAAMQSTGVSGRYRQYPNQDEAIALDSPTL